MALSEIKLIELPCIRDPRGNLTFIQNVTHVPFDIARVYWIYDVPSDGVRDGHAFRTQHELIAALSGSFDVTVDDGKERRTYTLNRPYQALLIPPMTWRSISNFSTNSAGMVLTSTLYSPADYIRSYPDFLAAAAAPQPQAQAPAPTLRRDTPLTHATSTVAHCRIIDLPRHSGPMGNLTEVENTADYPFDVRRVYYLYDVPSGAERGGHSHHAEQRLIVALSGAFDVTVDDGASRRTFTLNNPSRALYIPAGIWRTVDNFSSGSVCLALSSNVYDANDYVRDYSRFFELTKCKR
ncbi:MAG: WxcM-like domain-containing protein [Bacteroidales bacterium]|nr:WxcM-like domain-containing protein [Bacteroidales bacterium]MBD5377679.1 WxcM-like domain-containing protein [Bacteroides sp.]